MEHNRSKIIDVYLASGSVGFATGIIFASLSDMTAPATIVAGAVCACCLLIATIIRTTRPYTLFVCLFICSCILGMYRAEIAKPNTKDFQNNIGTSVTVEGLIVDEPSSKSYGDSFTLETPDLSFSVRTKSNTNLAYGDTILVHGTLALPENFMTDQGTEFDYISYLYKNNVLYQIKNASATVLEHNHGDWVVAHLIPVKNTIVKCFHRILPAPQADLLAGLNLGVKANIDPKFRDDLVTTGTIHMIALSGYNVTVVANALQSFFVDILGLSMRVASASGALCIVLFVVMTGMQSSAVRAGIMALIGLFARTKGRTYDAFRALIVAGFLMILYDPKYLVYDVSFQLSYLATLGILFVTPVLERAFARVPKKVAYIIPLRELMSVTLGAQTGVLPFILYKMGTLSLIALPANVAILPAVPLAMGFGALAGLIGSFSLGLAYPASLITHYLLSYITGAVQFFARVPFASVVIKHFPLWLCLLMYIFLAYWLYRKWRKPTMDSV